MHRNSFFSSLLFLTLQNTVSIWSMWVERKAWTNGFDQNRNFFPAHVQKSRCYERKKWNGCIYNDSFSLGRHWKFIKKKYGQTPVTKKSISRPISTENRMIFHMERVFTIVQLLNNINRKFYRDFLILISNYLSTLWKTTKIPHWPDLLSTHSCVRIAKYIVHTYLHCDSLPK